MAQPAGKQRRQPRVPVRQSLLSYWLQSLTVRRGFPPPKAPYQQREPPNVQLPGEHLISYHEIRQMPYGAYAVSPSLQIMQTYPFTGHTFNEGVPIGVRPFLRGHREYPHFPSARWTHTSSGPRMMPLEYSWHEEELR